MKTKFLQIVCLLAGLAASALADKPKASKWDEVMVEFDVLDKMSPPPLAPIVFVGSSSIRKWTTLAADFPGLPVINRGFGGSQMSDLLHHFDRVVTTYKPSQLVVYEGDNDLGAEKTPQQVLADFKIFCTRVRTLFPDLPVHFISTKPSPKRIAIIDKQREFNAMLVEYLATQKGMSFIDVFSLMLDESGKPKPSLFASDDLHMTPAGYELWTRAVKKALH